MHSRINSITVIGYRWFDRKSGNTYHNAVVMVNGSRIASTGFRYGYDRSYLQSAIDLLVSRGLLSASDAKQPFWKYCQDSGITLEYFPIDQPRRRDIINV